ncbi:VOC family protein [Actinopolymorpha sp. B17G11]|uniref:VOC family protein n=1 Tax=Actinopolymorpha sp. B17G11 TaxID=3160861 RepID=UPI0032E4EE31
MLERTGFPPGVPCWIDTSQPDPEAAVAFYSGVFGWELEDQVPADAPGRYFAARLGGRDVAAVGSQPDGAATTPMWNTYVWVDSADDTAGRVTAAGGQVIGEPFDVSDAGRMAMCLDPGGASFCLWQAGRHQGAQVVNAPNTWNWSDLHTHDLDEAAAFYGQVFGWEATPVDFGFGFGETVMWRRPGYAEFLETFDPGLRRRHSEGGAPEGFSDAIGWLLPLSGDDASAAPHWAVTFASADTDATVEAAAKLGGEIVVPPSDAGVTRIATLRDPQGAVFTVSTYTPAT